MFRDEAGTYIQKSGAANDNTRRRQVVRRRQQANAALRVLHRKRPSWALFWWVFTTAAYCSLIIFIFGLAALAFIGLGKSELIWGISIDDIVSVLGSLIELIGVDGAGNALASGVGLIFWFIGAAVALLSYLGLGLWVWLTEGKNPMQSQLGLIATIGCCALDIMIVTQLFPWLLVWIVVLQFVHVSSDGE